MRDDRPLQRDLAHTSGLAVHGRYDPPPAQPWEADALCAQIGYGWVDRHLFGEGDEGVGHGGPLGTGKRLCRTRCPVVDQCLAHALAIEDELGHALVGVWGGTSPRERRELRLGRQGAA